MFARVGDTELNYGVVSCLCLLKALDCAPFLVTTALYPPLCWIWQNFIAFLLLSMLASLLPPPIHQYLPTFLPSLSPLSLSFLNKESPSTCVIKIKRWGRKRKRKRGKQMKKHFPDSYLCECQYFHMRCNGRWLIWRPLRRDLRGSSRRFARTEPWVLRWSFTPQRDFLLVCLFVVFHPFLWGCWLLRGILNGWIICYRCQKLGADDSFGTFSWFHEITPRISRSICQLLSSSFPLYIVFICEIELIMHPINELMADYAGMYGISQLQLISIP